MTCTSVVTNSLLAGMVVVFASVSLADGAEPETTATTNPPTAVGPNVGGSCPGEPGPVVCVWEGPVEFQRRAMHTHEGAVYVTADPGWHPCSAKPGTKTRTYRVTASGSRLAALPAGAVEVPAAAWSEAPLASGETVRIQEKADGSVTLKELTIGELVPADKSPTRPVTIHVVCEDL